MLPKPWSVSALGFHCQDISHLKSTSSQLAKVVIVFERICLRLQGDRIFGKEVAVGEDLKSKVY